HADAPQHDAILVDVGMAAEPVVDRERRLHVIVLGDEYLADRAFALAPTVVDEVRHAALEELVSIHGAHDLLRSVHAVDADHAGKLFARFRLARAGARTAAQTV